MNQANSKDGMEFRVQGSRCMGFDKIDDFALTNATNKVENQQMILYRPLSENALYCREYSEFMEKFEKI